MPPTPNFNSSLIFLSSPSTLLPPYILSLEKPNRPDEDRGQTDYISIDYNLLTPDGDRLELFMSQVAGKLIEEVIASGRQKLALVPFGGGGAVSAAPSAGTTVAAELAKEENKPEEKEESDEDTVNAICDDDNICVVSFFGSNNVHCGSLSIDCAFISSSGYGN